MINDFALYVFASFIVTINYLRHSKLNSFKESCYWLSWPCRATCANLDLTDLCKSQRSAGPKVRSIVWMINWVDRRDHSRQFDWHINASDSKYA